MRRIFIALGGLAAVAALVTLIGTMLPSGHVASRSLVLKQPPESVWAVVTDYAGQPSWRKDITKVERVSEGPGGETWREEGSEPLLLQTTESVRPTRLVRTIADPTLPFGGRWVYAFEATASGGTRLTVTEEGEVYNPIFRVVSRFMDPAATIMQYLTNLAARFGEG
jgi:uncharacterized protein YndB with AHSA1/START domain